MQYHVICSRPGLNRGGRSNPPHALYEKGAHTPEQLRDLLQEPATHVVFGEAMTEEHVAAYEAELEAAKAAAEAEAADGGKKARKSA